MRELIYAIIFTAVLPSAYSMDTAKVWTELKKKNRCGTERLRDIQFHLTKKQIRSGDAFVIGGELKEGQIVGNSDRAYGGRSKKKDLMLIHRITDGPRLIGYNIKLSLCEKSEFYRGMKIIGPESKLTKFRIPGQMILGGSYNCPLGHIDSGHVTFKSNHFGIESLPISFEGVCSGPTGQQFARNFGR
ncbi:MAG: hypothetical protein HN509_14530 [Halobacteriovoraceae bacterium]|jgi:hypothetical protein|nr:hypothetical protein [Halobacteriovoraceae bacterium]MBT5094792.1 hypothetical protein [Halobacteriovoraceae bacterium]